MTALLRQAIFALIPALAVHGFEAQDFEISPEIFASRSPSGLLLDFMGTQGEDSLFREVVELLPSAAQTDYGVAVESINEAEFNCNLTGIDASCFLTRIAGQLGEPWGQAKADEIRAKSVIDQMLPSQNLVKEAAVLACIASPVYMRLFSALGYDAGTPEETINFAKSACAEATKQPPH